MASRNDGLAEVLVQLAANSAQLIEKARASGLFRQPEPVGVKASPAPEPAPAAPPMDAAEKSALQDIIVRQAMRIHELEAEVARLSKS